jgi:uncharacterized damage-inducible protein DinB
MLIDAKPLHGYPEPYGLLCSILVDGTREWRSMLDEHLSEDAVVWQPYPGTHSIGAIMLHIIGVEIFWFEGFALNLPPDPNERDLTLADKFDVEFSNWPEPPRKPISWYFDFHDRIRVRTLESIKKWPDPEFSREWEGQPRTLRWVLGHVIQHEAYHGGQAVLLNRLWALHESAGSK